MPTLVVRGEWRHGACAEARAHLVIHYGARGIHEVVAALAHAPRILGVFHVTWEVARGELADTGQYGTGDHHGAAGDEIGRHGLARRGELQIVFGEGARRHEAAAGVPHAVSARLLEDGADAQSRVRPPLEGGGNLREELSGNQRIVIEEEEVRELFLSLEQRETDVLAAREAEVDSCVEQREPMRIVSRWRR